MRFSVGFLTKKWSIFALFLAPRPNFTPLVWIPGSFRVELLQVLPCETPSWATVQSWSPTK